jgi:adenylate kinase
MAAENMQRASAALRVIIAGAPASGKGTQCELIKAKFGLVHLSTGDMLRSAVAAGSEVGIKAKEYMDAGGLVPDDTIIGVVRDRLSQSDCSERGWLLDGFRG